MANPIGVTVHISGLIRMPGVPAAGTPDEDAIISIGPPVAMIIFGVVDATLSAVQELPRGTKDVDTAMSCLPSL